VKVPIEAGKISAYISALLLFRKLIVLFCGYDLTGVAGMLVNPDEPTVRIGNETRNNTTASILIVEADTIEEVRDFVENDVYWKKGVVSVFRAMIQIFYAHILHV
jgi:hypothetical protein